jgi:nucleotide-binding universal stress UspA family protein
MVEIPGAGDELPVPVGGRVVVGVDDSPGALHALRWALEEAARRGATLEVVHAWEPPLAFGPVDLGPIPVPDDGERQAAARAVLEGVVARALEVPGPRPPELDRVLVADGPASAVLDRSRDADLLVLGRRGRGGFAGLLLGSVSHQCITHARCPVVVVPPPGRAR